MSGRVTHGADVEQLDDIAVALRRQGSRIADVGGRGSAHLEKLRALWDGPDFEKFAQEWRAAHRIIDDAESSLRTYSRTLAAESEQQRQSSQVGSGGFSGGQTPGGGFTRVEGGPAFQRVDEGPDVGRLEGGPAFQREDEGPDVGRLEGGPAFQREDEGLDVGRLEGVPAFQRDGEGPAIERVEGGPAFQRVEQLPDGRTGLTIDSPDGPVHLASSHGMLVTGDLMATLPDLPGLEAISADDPGGAQPVAFERMDPGGGSAEAADVGSGEAFERSSDSGESTSSSPAQVPTGDGGHVTTAADSAGQHSVAFDPTGLASQTSQVDWVDSSSVSSWLGLDGLDILPWSQA